MGDSPAERSSNDPTPVAAPPDCAAPAEAHDAAHYWRLFRRLGPAGPLALIAGSLPVIVSVTVITLLTRIGPWLREHPVEGMAIYIGGFIALGGLGILATWAHSVLGGWAFGFLRGFPAAMTAFVGAASLAYAVGRWAAGDRVLGIIREHPKSKAVYEALLGSGFRKSLLIITLVRLSPNSPYAITNLAFSAARVNFLAYLIGTLVGMAPRTGIVVFLASKLAQLDFDTPRWLWISGIAVTLIVISIIAHLASKALAQVTNCTTSPAAE